MRVTATGSSSSQAKRTRDAIVETAHRASAYTPHPLRHPCVVFWLCLAAVLAMAGSGLAILATTVDPITQDLTVYDLQDRRSVAYDSLRLCVAEVGRQRTRNDVLGAVMLYARGYPVPLILTFARESTEDEGERGSIFSRPYMEQVRQTEQLLLSSPRWPTVCFRASVGGCTAPSSSTQVFFASKWDYEKANDVLDSLRAAFREELYNYLVPCVDWDRNASSCAAAIACPVDAVDCDVRVATMTVDEFEFVQGVRTKIRDIVQHWDGRGGFAEDTETVSLFIAQMLRLPTEAGRVATFVDKDFEKTNPASKYTRSLLFLNAQRAADSQALLLDKESGDSVAEELEEREGGLASMAWVFPPVLFDMVLEKIVRDLLLLVASALMVYAHFYTVMERSIFLSTVAMCEVLASTAVAYMITRMVFQIEYFGVSSLVVLFLATSVGADDVFVLFFEYKEPDGKKLGREQHLRTMWWAAAGKMGMTSLTTCAALVTTCTTPLASMCSFGVFAATAVFCDYVFSITLLASAMVVYHDYFESRTWGMIWAGAMTAVRSSLGRVRVRVPALAGAGSSQRGRVPDVAQTVPPAAPVPTESPAKTGNQYAHQVHKVRGWVSEMRVGDGIAWVFGEGLELLMDRAVRTAIVILVLEWVVVCVYFCSQFEPAQTSEQLLNSADTSQRATTRVVDYFDAKDAPRTGLPVHFVWGIGEVDRDGVGRWGLLHDPTKYGEATFLDAFDFESGCQRALQRACEAVQEDAKAAAAFQKSEYGVVDVRCLVQEPYFPEDQGLGRVSEQPGVRGAVERAVDEGDIAVGWDGESVRFAGFTLYSQTLLADYPRSEGVTQAAYATATEVAFLANRIVGDACGAGVEGVMTDLDQRFTFMNTQRLYRESALVGPAIGSGVCFATVLLATGFRPLLALYAVLNVLAVIVTVVGIVSMMGWDLGTVEAVFIIILSGLGVDYVVHVVEVIAQAKVDLGDKFHAQLIPRMQRVMLPVFNGMLSSVLGILPLLFADVYVYVKFALFVLLTVLFSWLFANVVTFTLVITFGVDVPTSLRDRVMPKPHGEAPVSVVLPAAAPVKSASVVSEVRLRAVSGNGSPA